MTGPSHQWLHLTRPASTAGLSRGSSVGCPSAGIFARTGRLGTSPIFHNVDLRTVLRRSLESEQSSNGSRRFGDGAFSSRVGGCTLDVLILGIRRSRLDSASPDLAVRRASISVLTGVDRTREQMRQGNDGEGDDQGRAKQGARVAGSRMQRRRHVDASQGVEGGDALEL